MTELEGSEDVRQHRKGTRLLLERRLEHDRKIVGDMNILFPLARATKPHFPFGKKKLAAMYQHDKAEAQQILAAGGSGGAAAGGEAAAKAKGGGGDGE